jgi:hypothetical protein
MREKAIQLLNQSQFDKITQVQHINAAYCSKNERFCQEYNARIWPFCDNIP